jgi:hypothetical protein
MRIEAKLSHSIIIRCDCERTFNIRRLGPSVECPHCGTTALSPDLVMEWHLSRGKKVKTDAA